MRLFEERRLRSMSDEHCGVLLDNLGESRNTVMPKFSVDE